MEPTERIPYIPFLDGVIGYNCIACNAKCCRGGHIGTLPHEKKFLLEKWPGLAAFQMESHENYTVYRKEPPKCWFLQNDLRCRIESEFGKAKKPQVCRAHPIYFESITLGKWAVRFVTVAPGCVWVTGDLSSAIGTLSWDEVHTLHEEFDDHGLYGTPQGTLSPKMQWLPQAFKQLFLAEERIRDKAKTVASLQDYFSWQLAYTHRIAATGSHTVTVGEAEVERAKDILYQLRARVRSVLCTTGNDQPLGYPLVPFVSMLRLNLIKYFLSKEDFWSASKTPRQTFARVYELITRMLVVLTEYAKAHSVVESHSSLDFKTVSALQQTFMDRILVLANLDRNTAEIFGELKPQKTGASTEFLSLLECINGKQIRVFGDLVQEHTKSLEAGPRLQLMDKFAPSLIDGLTNSGGA